MSSNTLRVIDADTIRRLAPPRELIGWMREAMIATSRREVELPLRRGMQLPDGLGVIGMMPGYVGAQFASAGVKLVSLVPQGRRRGSSHLGLMVLYDADGLLPLAILCGATITALRTAAASAAATDTLARRDSRRLAILGAGEQAEAHIAALAKVRDFEEVRIWARRPEQAVELAHRLGDGGALRAVRDASEAVRGVDVVCTVSGAREPILTGGMIDEGTHLNLVGSSVADAREVDDELVRRGRFYVDFLPSALDQAGEFLHARANAVVDDRHIVAEIGAVYDGRADGRLSEREITVYKSLGIAAQDVVTARRVYERALQLDLGATVSI